MHDPIDPFLKAQGMFILDGGLATELEWRGYDLKDPLWSARLLLAEPQAIQQVHADYLAAGADCVISASYQASLPGLIARGLSETAAADVIRLSVRLAQAARDAFWAEAGNRVGRLRPLVAASIGPYGAYLANGAEYTGDYDLDTAGLLAWHRRRWHILTASGADVLACETCPSYNELEAYRQLLLETPQMPAWVSFTARDGRHISDGTPLEACVARLHDLPNVVAVGVNCTPPRLIPALIDTIQAATDKKIAVYPNSGERYEGAGKGWRGESDPSAYGTMSREWRKMGAALVGGCCRTRPAHIQQIRDRVRNLIPVFILLLCLGVNGCTGGAKTAIPASSPTAVGSAAAVVTVTPVSVSLAIRPAYPAATLEPPPLPTAVPTRTPSPVPSATPPPAATVTATLPPLPAEVHVNGMAPGWFVIMPAETVQRARQIYAQGQALGRDGHRFSKIGDSIVDTDEFFTWFDTGHYDLGDYAYLQGVIDYYGGSYGRFGMALRDGLNSTAVMDPTWADKESCLPNETPLACEIRLHNPAVILIHFGTNDWTGTYDANMRRILDYAIDQGVVPVLITKANRVEGGNFRNEILRQLAAEYHVPVWDYDRIAETLPNRGLDQDNAHMTINQRPEYNSGWTITTGYGAFNLTGLMVLDTFLRQVVLAETP